MTRSVIVGHKRSPMGKFLGSLSGFSAPQLGATVAKGLLASVNCPPEAVEMALVGQVVQSGAGQNPSRQVALSAGIPDTVTAVTLNQVCGSGLRAVMDADNNIRLGDIKIALAGGIESMSNAPHLLRGLRTGGVKFGEGKLEDAMMTDGLNCAFEKWAMGFAAEYIAKKHNVTREDQDSFSLQSTQRAEAAHKAGLFKGSIVPFEIKGKKESTFFSEDETIRFGATMADLAKLKPAFDPNGTVTAGNASQLADGAAMLLVASEDEAKKRGWPVLARIVSHCTFGVAPKELFIAPVGAVRKAIDRAGLKMTDIDVFEINEAFAAQMVACQRGLELSADRLNLWGGGISLGHPIGCSGARVLGTLIDVMAHKNAKRGVASLCLGGGNAVAMVIERP
jgi:acetyl-CoA C-acetyltransferase